MPVGKKCMHCKVKDQDIKCEAELDVWGDHCVLCGIGGHKFTRHSALNHVLAEAGRAAGYSTLLEQVVPEFASIKTSEDGSIAIVEARIDVELYGHAYAPDHLLDGTIRHPVTKSHLVEASREGGHSAEKGVKDKLKRYPPKHGKALIGCAMETWGRFSKSLDALLEELAGLAGRRQRDRGVQPTKWLLKWRTQISLCVAVHIGRCILDALPNDVRNYRHQHLSVPFSEADSWDSGNPYPGSGRLNTLAPD